MFRQSQTNNNEWFAMKQKFILKIQYDIKSLLKYRSKIDEEIGAMKSKLNESEEKRKSEIEWTEGKGYAQMAVGFVVGVLLTALIARCCSLDLSCSSARKLPAMATRTGQLETGKSTILGPTIKNLTKHSELYPPERQSITEMIIAQFDWLPYSACRDK